MVKDWEEGTAVELSGRLQSRQYDKTVDGVTKKNTCYEVSVNTISIKES
jgi:hypothetical protein